MKVNSYYIIPFLFFILSCHNDEDAKKIIQQQSSIDSLLRDNNELQYQLEKLSNKILEDKANAARQKSHSPNGNKVAAINAVKPPETAPMASLPPSLSWVTTFEHVPPAAILADSPFTNRNAFSIFSSTPLTLACAI